MNKFILYGGKIINRDEIESVRFPSEESNSGRHWEIGVEFMMRSGSVVSIEPIVVGDDQLLDVMLGLAERLNGEEI